MKHEIGEVVMATIEMVNQCGYVAIAIASLDDGTMGSIQIIGSPILEKKDKIRCVVTGHDRNRVELEPVAIEVIK